MFTLYFHRRWLAAEKEDGEVERLIQASGARTCQEMLVHSAAKHIKENHLWFSIFFRYIIFLLLFLLKLKSQLFVYMTFFPDLIVQDIPDFKGLQLRLPFYFWPCWQMPCGME